MRFVLKLGRLWVWLLWLGAGAWLGVKHQERIIVQLPPQLEIPVASGLALVLAFAAGSLLSGMALGLDVWRKHRECRRLRRSEVPTSEPLSGGKPQLELAPNP